MKRGNLTTLQVLKYLAECDCAEMATAKAVVSLYRTNHFSWGALLRGHDLFTIKLHRHWTKSAGDNDAILRYTPVLRECVAHVTVSSILVFNMQVYLFDIQPVATI